MQNINYIGYIYKTTNTVNNKIYIGKRQKPEFDKYYIGSGKKLKSAIKHYGKEAFECVVLQWCQSLQELNEAEKYWIIKLDSRNEQIGYNISAGGDGGDIFHTMSKEEQLQAIKKQVETSELRGSGTRGKFRVYKYVNNEPLVLFVLQEELAKYIADGWTHGLEPTLAKKQGEIRSGRKQSKEWIKKRCESIWNKSEEEIALTKKRHSDAAKKQMENMPKESRSALGKKARQAALAKLNGQKAIWIHKENTRKLIAENTIEEWLLNGWKRGFKLDE